MDLLTDSRKDMTELKFVAEITQSWEDAPGQSLEEPLPDVGRKIRKALEIQETEEERTAGLS